MSKTKFYIPKPKVYHFIPWNSDKNIGKSYNEMMSLIGDNDWACFLDGDAVHTTHFFGSRIESVINDNPEYSLFTCYTNRVNCGWQIAPNVDIKSNDQKYHREFGEKLWNENGTLVTDNTNSQLMSGVMIMISKDTWRRVGGFKEEKMLSIDNDIHSKVKHLGLKLGLMTGIYLQHWYRGGDMSNKEHLL